MYNYHSQTQDTKKIWRMFKFCNTLTRVIILLHIVEALIGPPLSKNRSNSCLTGKKIENPNVCLTDTCKQQANFMLQRMDLSKAPCDNFYLFACGNMLRSLEPLPHIYESAEAEAKAHVENILNISDVRTDDSKLLQLMKNANRECISGGKTVKEFQSILLEFGGPPMFISDWPIDSFSWTDIYQVARKYGYEVNDMFSIFVDKDKNYNSRKIIYITTPKFYNHQVHTFKNDHLTVDNINKNLGPNFMRDIFTFFGANADEYTKEINDMFSFATEVKKAFENATNDYLVQYIFELNDSYPSIPWLDIINILIAPLEYDAIEQVIVPCPDCLKKLDKLLQRTPKRVIADYVRFHFILENINFLTVEIRKKLTKYLPTTIEKTCQEMTIKYFYMILDHVYIQRYYNKAYIGIAQLIYDDVITQLKQTILQTNLFESNDEKSLATEKLEALIIKLGVNDARILDYQELEKYYDAVNFTDLNNYMWSMKRFLFTEAYHSLSDISRPSRYMRASKMEATNHLDLNTIHISAATIKAFLQLDVPQYIIYAHLGDIIGHELAHTFGSDGIHFDKDGTQQVWFNYVTSSNVQRIRRCFSAQYGKYKILSNSHSVNGDAVAEEAISFDGGFYLSYNAYNRSNNIGLDMMLPGLENYTARQMFWISSATAWCQKDTPLDVSIEHLRIYLGLQNSKNFAEDFQCPVGSVMNPNNKCSFWEAK